MGESRTVADLEFEAVSAFNAQAAQAIAEDVEMMAVFEEGVEQAGHRTERLIGLLIAHGNDAVATGCRAYVFSSAANFVEVGSVPADDCFDWRPPGDQAVAATVRGRLDQLQARAADLLMMNARQGSWTEPPRAGPFGDVAAPLSLAAECQALGLVHDEATRWLRAIAAIAPAVDSVDLVIHKPGGPHDARG